MTINYLLPLLGVLQQANDEDYIDATLLLAQYQLGAITATYVLKKIKPYMDRSRCGLVTS